jgi:two-component system response regulator HydG
MAEGGTLYLSGVGGLGHALQGKLLRTLRDREGALGSTFKQQQPDVRIIASSTRDMVPLLDRNLFREDLFYRLSVLTIQVPPLRERGEDAIALTRHLIARFSYALGRPAPSLSDSALELLRAHTWPGNVGELEDTVWGVLCTLDGDVIEPAHIPDGIRRTALTRVDPQRPLAEVEADYVGQVLASVQGNKTKAADILGVDRKTLRDRLKARDAGR